MKRVEELNRANPLARFGANVFADLTASEFKSRHNAERHYSARKHSTTPIAFGAADLSVASWQKIDWRANASGGFR